jgi:hypothetical protein
MDTDGQVGVSEPLESSIALFKLLKVARNASQLIVPVPDAVQRKVDDNLGTGATSGDGLNRVGNGSGEKAIGRDVDNPWMTVLVQRLAESYDLSIEEGLATTYGHPIRNAPQAPKDFIPLLKAQLICLLLPYMASHTAGVTAWRRCNGQVQRQYWRPAELVAELIEWYLS